MKTNHKPTTSESMDEKPGAVVAEQATLQFDPMSWSSVRDQFALTRSRAHMTCFLLSSHPRSVAEAIERHRRGFDEDPARYWHQHFRTAEPDQRKAAGEYLGANPDHIALTDSTTMGLGLVYGALDLQPGKEILTTTHDHYSTEMSLKYRAERTGASVRQVSLYEDPATVTEDELISRLLGAITANTRVVAVTWVHSSTGVKLPIAQMGAALREVNENRDIADQIVFCVDGVHGLGIEDTTMDELNCDFFIAGTHKWLFGPRGTGLIWGRPEAWQSLIPVIPGFGDSYGVWLGYIPLSQVAIGDHMTPGGFHSFEHRWALKEAFEFHQAIGKARVQERVQSLNRVLKEALMDIPHVRLHTPMAPSLSSGLVCFDVDGYSAAKVARKLVKKGISAGTSPYRQSYARLGAGLVNNEEEVEKVAAVVGKLE